MTPKMGLPCRETSLIALCGTRTGRSVMKPSHNEYYGNSNLLVRVLEPSRRPFNGTLGRNNRVRSKIYWKCWQKSTSNSLAAIRILVQHIQQRLTSLEAGTQGPFRTSQPRKQVEEVRQQPGRRADEDFTHNVRQ